MKATKIIAVLAVALVAGTMGLTSCSKGKSGSGKVKGKLLPEGNFEVELTKDGSGVVIKDYDMKDWKKNGEDYVKKDVTIPSTIQGLPVKGIIGIGDLKYAITGLVIPEGVEFIYRVGGEEWFEGATNLTSVSLPSTLKAIGYKAFMHCDNLAVCNLPEGLEFIGEKAFYFTGLKSVSLPKSLKYIGDNAFYSDNLAEINIPEGLEVISFPDYKDLDFTHIFGGDGIDKSLALQKLLKETKPKEIIKSIEFDEIPEEMGFYLYPKISPQSAVIPPVRALRVRLVVCQAKMPPGTTVFRGCCFF